MRHQEGRTTGPPLVALQAAQRPGIAPTGRAVVRILCIVVSTLVRWCPRQDSNLRRFPTPAAGDACRSSRVSSHRNRCTCPGWLQGTFPTPFVLDVLGVCSCQLSVGRFATGWDHEITGWLINEGYEPVGRWQVESDDSAMQAAETMRRFKLAAPRVAGVLWPPARGHLVATFWPRLHITLVGSRWDLHAVQWGYEDLTSTLD